ncbi:Aste57867_21195 [Aphanomyces stellatus]|uniref:Aste57867_21195 protein n=1 Tax=Aphanomyces stellatus TaxID=120398 RepID=A0A485LI65_9STRA|nr:hypothetical protein As57867_021127 [Aphanomyces stellatus]VFT97869.1 Aste57867_21195 [Aphanomyces stellatus]
MGRRTKLSSLALLLLSALSLVAAKWTPFGTLLGVTDGGVDVYSCHLEENQTALGQDPNYVNGVYTGVKWQCVELARRYLLVNLGVIFGDVDYAFQIFDFNSIEKVDDKSQVAFNKFVNGGSIPPVHGSLIIWSPYGEMTETGHVAVVVDVTDTYVDIVEQNVEDSIWPQGQTYSRRLKVKKNSTSFFIEKWYDEEHILGWMTVDVHTRVTLAAATSTTSSGPVYFALVVFAVAAAAVVYRKRTDQVLYERVK